MKYHIYNYRFTTKKVTVEANSAADAVYTLLALMNSSAHVTCVEARDDYYDVFTNVGLEFTVECVD